MQDNSKYVALTAGICNIPLTKPAIPHFLTNDDDETIEIGKMFASFGIPFRMSRLPSDKTHVSSVKDVEPSIIKQIFRNFRRLKPRLLSQYRYLFWEVDSQDEQILHDVLVVFKFLKLPVYVHKTMRGYHFLSVKPIEKQVWNFAIQQLRNTNPRFPPVTLRILANKYPNEIDYYLQGFCYYPNDNIHKDTEYLKKWIEQQDIIKLEQYYMIVFYRLPNQKQLDEMTIEQRSEFQNEQIANSEDNRISLLGDSKK